MVTDMELFQIPDFLSSLLQDLLHLIHGDSALHHHDYQVIKKITDFVGRVLIFSVFGCNDDFTALLTAFFQYLSNPCSKR